MDEEDFDRLWTSLVDRKYGKTGEPLNQNEQLLYALNLFAGGVPRSGLIGYFQNSTGKEILDAKSALQVLQLDRHLKILEDAQLVLLGEQKLEPTDDEIEILPCDLTEDEYERASEELERKVSPIETEFEVLEDDLDDGILRFIETRGITAPT